MSNQSWNNTTDRCLRRSSPPLCERGQLDWDATHVTNLPHAGCAELGDYPQCSNPSHKLGTSIADHIPEHIKKVSRSIGYALWLNGENQWLGLELVIPAHLDQQQREALAYMALKSLSYDDAKSIAESVLDIGAGQPIAPLLNYMDEALFWADMAFPEELDAYCLASFERMDPARQAAFLEHVQGGK